MEQRGDTEDQGQIQELERIERETERTPENLGNFIERIQALQNDPARPDFIESSSPKVKTHRRMIYESEVSNIKRQVGDLEDIRARLGLSRRKMGQLLLVDPSAWTRWTRNGAPPVIYRALEWYMLLTREVPAQAHSYWITAAGGRVSHDSGQFQQIKREVDDLKAKLRDSEVRLRRLKWLSLILPATLVAAGWLAWVVSR